VRTFELHASVKSISRSAGRSSVAAAAYRAGEKLEDKRTGLMHDYTRKNGVEHSQIFTPANAPAWAIEREKLWQAVEIKENRTNSMTARELEIAFPAEFNSQQRLEAGQNIAQDLVRRYGCAVDIAWHSPHKNGDDRNHHAHIMFTTRAIDASTKDGWSKTKCRALNNDRIIVEGKPTTRSAQEVSHLREMVAKTMNHIAHREKLAVKTEHLSFEKRGIDREPSQKMGQHATEMERKGKQSERGNANHEIKAANDELQKVKETAQIISFELEKSKRELAKERELQRQVNESRKRWCIDELVTKRNQTKAEFEKKNASFWSKFFGAQHKAQENFDNATKQLLKKSQGFAQDIINIYKNEPLERKYEALQKHGFTVKEKYKKEPQNRQVQVLKEQYNEKITATQQIERPKVAKPRQERESSVGFER